MKDQYHTHEICVITVDYFENDTVGQLRERVELLETNRAMVMWHDHSNITSHCHYVVNVYFIYDPAVYLTKAEAG